MVDSDNSHGRSPGRYLASKMTLVELARYFDSRKGATYKSSARTSFSHVSERFISNAVGESHTYNDPLAALRI
jgi:hypothetical protein